jgi:hypothetical protein
LEGAIERSEWGHYGIDFFGLWRGLASVCQMGDEKTSVRLMAEAKFGKPPQALGPNKGSTCSISSVAGLASHELARDTRLYIVAFPRTARCEMPLPNFVFATFRRYFLFFPVVFVESHLHCFAWILMLLDHRRAHITRASHARACAHYTRDVHTHELVRQDHNHNDSTSNTYTRSTKKIQWTPGPAPYPAVSHTTYMTIGRSLSPVAHPVLH